MYCNIVDLVLASEISLLEAKFMQRVSVMELNYINHKPFLPKISHMGSFKLTINNPLSSHFLSKKPVRYIWNTFLKEELINQLSFKTKNLETDSCPFELNTSKTHLKTDSFIEKTQDTISRMVDRVLIKSIHKSGQKNCKKTKCKD